MKRSVLFSISCLFSTAYLAGADVKQPNKKYEITVTCNEDLQKINNDYGWVLNYFEGVFKSLAELNRVDRKPSDIITYFQTEQCGIDKTVRKHYMPATDYIRLVSKHNATFDAAFQKQLSLTPPAGTETTQPTAQNPWLVVHTLFNDKLKEVCVEFKTKVVEEDAEKLRLAKMGIFIHGRTIFVNPDLAVVTNTIKKEEDKQ
jgi:hypothetical protein